MNNERGFACLGLVSPKTAENVGGVLRAAHCYRVAQVNISGGRNDFLRHATNTPMAHRHTPVFLVKDVFEYLPIDTEIVAVDLVDGAMPLPSFRHPQRALYVFGPEDGTIGEAQIGRADHVVYIPTRNCMNLASTVNVVLYDRLLKSTKTGPNYSCDDARAATT